ncbi:nucleotidyltransferase family protein [Micromonospora sp. NPDC050200]|uniref:nucleotidyltransferase family protein n=1 Tax=Micromonospora sp. NPDC050200 TaxID=3155664 RepID=UPI0033ED9018
MREDELRGLAQQSPWLVRALRVVRDSGLPDAWIGAGAIRDLVWGERYGDGFDPSSVRDVDVVFLDPTDLSRDNDDRATGRLVATWPEPPWEAKNQAAVHTWYSAKFGGAQVAPLHTIADAVATWPEYATAVAVRLDTHDRVTVCAPHGPDDLLDGVWRCNPTRVSPIAIAVIIEPFSTSHVTNSAPCPAGYGVVASRRRRCQGSAASASWRGLSLTSTRERVISRLKPPRRSRIHVGGARRRGRPG